MLLSKVKEYFAARGLSERITILAPSDDPCVSAAQIPACREAQIVRIFTLSSPSAAPIRILTGFDRKADSEKCKARLFGDSPLQEPFTIAESPAFCPFPLSGRTNDRIYLDSSLLRFETVYVLFKQEQGEPKEAAVIALAPFELELYTGAVEWADICVPSSRDDGTGKEAFPTKIR